MAVRDECLSKLPFVLLGDMSDQREVMQMDESNPTMAPQIAQAVLDFERQRTGHAPQSANVVLKEDTLVVTVRGALSAAEKAAARSPVAAAQMQEFHRQLFVSSSEALRDEIKRITGVAVRESRLEVETMTGAVMERFATGTIVQVFLLERPIPASVWNGSG
jgi:uncharacterized protein YbcI